MYNLSSKYRKYLKSLPFAAFLLFCNNVYPQLRDTEDSTRITNPGAVIHVHENEPYIVTDSILKHSASHIRIPVAVRGKNEVFYDSLKAKADKKSITRKLYDFIFVAHDTLDSKHVSGSSELSYIRFSGMKIRRIDVKRLDVFGSDINNFDNSKPGRTENVLNKTHINTNENIIRKNLIFSAGDTISPLTLSDNERILRQLPFIDDARIIVVPVSKEEADILVLTKDVYSLGGDYAYKGIKAGTAQVFEKNILGMGHELGVEIPWDSRYKDSPGFGAHYSMDNLWKSFVNMNVYYQKGLGEKTYGFGLSRNLVSSTTKYAGGISVKQMYTSANIDTLSVPSPLKYNLQDYWLARSFLINRQNVTKIILGARYINNNVFAKPQILPDTYYSLQRYRIFLGSAAFSFQKYYKTNLIYGYGRTEDIPYGGLLKITVGKELNEFKKRTYLASELSLGESINNFGYLYSSAGLGTFLNNHNTEQGTLTFQMKYFSNLLTMGKYRIRNFVNLGYTRGFNRNKDEHLIYYNDNGFSGFKNDSVSGTRRLTLSLESEFFSPVNLYGFRFAFFTFADFSSLSGSNQPYKVNTSLTGLGVGIRIRNDNLVFNTFQIRIGIFPDPPQYSKINYLTISGEQLLRPNNFDPGPPAIIPYR